MASEGKQDRRETLADIERDLRDRADCAERHGDRETHNDGVAMLMRSIADRIEATWKREKAEAEANALDVGGIVEAAWHTPGNSAALREAAATVYNVLEKLKTSSLHIGDIGHKREFNHLVCLAKNRLDAALSAPARNCDLCDSYGDAIRAFEDTEDAEEYEDMAEWLLAPAEERKGDCDGR